MIDFIYTAKDQQTGEVRKGKISADSRSVAAGILIEKSLYPIKIQEASEAQNFIKKNAIGSGVKTKDRVIFVRQLSTLVKAGLPITQALNTAINQVTNKNFKASLDKIAASVEGGQSLASSFAQYPKLFDHIFISLVDAGEQSGTLDQSLERLADQQEKQQQILGKVRGALVYPVIVFVVIIGVVVFMITTVLPQVANLYKELEKPLPAATGALLSGSTAVINYWYVFLLLVVAIVFGIRAYIQTEGGRRLFDRLKLHVPLFKNLFRKVYAARFSRTLSSLVNSGVPLLKSLKISAEAVDNVVIKDIVNKAAERVKTGEALSVALSGHEELVQLVPQMIKVGEESGSLGPMLEKVAEFFESEVDQAVKNLSATIEPIMIVFLGVVVLLIVVGILFPIYSLVSVVGTTGTSANPSAPIK